jgi:hypothetical protein
MVEVSRFVDRMCHEQELSRCCNTSLLLGFPFRLESPAPANNGVRPSFLVSPSFGTQLDLFGFRVEYAHGEEGRWGHTLNLANPIVSVLQSNP